MHLGICCNYVTGVEKDGKEAVFLFQLAVDDENSEGYMQFGLRYKTGPA